MPRKPKCRKINMLPRCQKFKPAGIPAKKLTEISMTLDEYEAIRLADLEGLEHLEASQKMNISRSTFTRLIEKARKKFAQLITGKYVLSIQGGNIELNQYTYQCQSCEKIVVITPDKKLENCPNCKANKWLDLAPQYGFQGNRKRQHNGGRHEDSNS